MLNIEDLQVHPHPFKAELKKHGVSIAMAAKYLNLTYMYVWGMLSGTYKMSRPVKEKLQLLIDQLESPEPVEGVVPV